MLGTEGGSRYCRDQDWDYFLEDAEHRYDSQSHSDYTGFLNWLESRCENKGYEFSDWKEKFPDPSTNYIYAELEDEDVEGELWYLRILDHWQITKTTVGSRKMTLILT